MDFVVFSDDWGEHPSSCQHLFRHIARSHRVLWVNTVGMRAPVPTVSDAAKALRKIRRMVRSDQKSIVRRAYGAQLDLEVIQPPMLPFPGVSIARKINDWSGKRAASRAIASRGMRRPVVVTTVPNVCDVVSRIDASLIVYYCVDDFARWPGSNYRVVREMEQRLVKNCDLILAASRQLVDNLGASGVDTYLFEHGVDLDTFGARPGSEHACFAGMPRPRAGFFGLIDQRLNQELLAQVARLLPNFTFVLAGPQVTDLRRIKLMHNVRLIGALSYEQLPRFVDGLDVLILPYRVNELTNTISPLKLNEYLATGLPVVSSPLLNLMQKKSEWMRIADRPIDWEVALTGALRESRSTRRAALLPLLESQSWEGRAMFLINSVQRHLTR